MASLPAYRYEHIFIDNNSTDSTVAILRALAAADTNVKVILNARNFGHLRSPMHGLYEARGHAVVLLLSDLQDPPELIRDMVIAWERVRRLSSASSNPAMRTGSCSGSGRPTTGPSLI